MLRLISKYVRIKMGKTIQKKNYAHSVMRPSKRGWFSDVKHTLKDVRT